MRSRRHRLRSLRFRPIDLAFACAVFVGTVTGGLLAPGGSAFVEQTSARLLGADSPGRPATLARVIDGDTVVTDEGERVRVLNVDAPELPPHSRCAREEDLALTAKARVIQLVAETHEVRLVSAGVRDRDVYGRELRLIRLDGSDLGERLIDEGLAQPWRGHHATWC